MTTLQTITNEIKKLENQLTQVQTQFNEPLANYRMLGQEEDLINDALTALTNVFKAYEQEHMDQDVTSLNEK